MPTTSARRPSGAARPASARPRLAGSRRTGCARWSPWRRRASGGSTSSAGQSSASSAASAPMGPWSATRPPHRAGATPCRS